MSVFVAPFVFKEPQIRRFVGCQPDPVALLWAAQRSIIVPIGQFGERCPLLIESVAIASSEMDAPTMTVRFPVAHCRNLSNCLESDNSIRVSFW